MQGSSINVATEVKMLGTDKELVWKFEGNKIQFLFSSELKEIAKQISCAIEHYKQDYSNEPLLELTEKITKRQYQNSKSWVGYDEALAGESCS